MKVLAANIDNLTDARYFAAIPNVEFISINVTREAKDKIIELINWIEGPKIILNVSDLDFIDEAVISIPAHFVYNITEECWYKGSLNTSDDEYPNIITINNPNDLNGMRLNLNNLFINCDKIDDALIEKLKALNAGIVVSGGEEEEIGIKSFDELDELFEKLEL